MNWPKYIVLSYNLVLNCDVVILLAMLSCWLLTYDDVYQNWVELRVYGKTLIMNY